MAVAILATPRVDFAETLLLEKLEADHCHQGMLVESFPGRSFEVIEAEFLLQLLMGLLA